MVSNLASSQLVICIFVLLGDTKNLIFIFQKFFIMENLKHIQVNRII